MAEHRVVTPDVSVRLRSVTPRVTWTTGRPAGCNPGSPTHLGLVRTLTRGLPPLALTGSRTLAQGCRLGLMNPTCVVRLHGQRQSLRSSAEERDLPMVEGPGSNPGGDTAWHHCAARLVRT